ncbi:unnamed protein product, partial [Didymodactylos carnosus]
MVSIGNLLEPIAVIGLSCAFAGDINSPDDLWNVLKDSVNVNSEIPKERLDLESYVYDRLTNDPLLKDTLIHRGYFMSTDNLDKFDPGYFGLTDNDTLLLEPGHRILLQKFVHLLDDAGYTIDQIRGTNTSIYIGQFSSDFQRVISRQSIEHRKRLMDVFSGLFNASARIAYHFDLHGPNATIDTACSSSLQAIHIACQTLRNNEADYAVAGGISVHFAPDMFYGYSLIGAVSPDGRSRSFSNDANGYGKGEGCGLVFLKRLTDAERDGDRIYCLIHDIISNHDGQRFKTGYTAPTEFAQNLLLNKIYSRNPQIDRNDIFYAEAHGTGTQVGDPIEANALGHFFNRTQFDSPLLIGSVKSNIGHTEGAAGVAPLIKVALCMKHRLIPPQMHFKQLNPKIRARQYNLHVVQHLTHFPSSSHISTYRPVLIGINSFGIGGNNAHCIVQEYLQPPSQGLQNGHTKDEIEEQYMVLMFSSKCQKSLKTHIQKCHHWLSNILMGKEEEEKNFLIQLSYKLLFHRTLSYSQRISFVFKDQQELQQQLLSFLSDKNYRSGVSTWIDQTDQYNEKTICFVYSGQGPQWWSMGRQLYYTEPIFRQWIDRIDYELKQVTHDWSLLDELIYTKEEHQSRINDTNIAQPCLFALQVALTALWLSWNVYPKVIVGHSVGEIAAAYINGHFTLK